jgi:ferric-dicitrate binding protein FerR (iron transport regulator)
MSCGPTVTDRGVRVNRMDRAAPTAYASLMASEKPDRQARQRDALREIDRLNRPETVFGSARFADATKRIGDHFAAAEAPREAPGDPIELWGRRIGRTLSAIVFVGLAIYLYLTYLR